MRYYIRAYGLDFYGDSKQDVVKAVEKWEEENKPTRLQTLLEIEEIN